MRPRCAIGPAGAAAATTTPGRWWPICRTWGPELGPYLPVANIFIVTGVPWLYPMYARPWDPLGSLVYFSVIVGAVFGAAGVVLKARDA